MSKADGVIIVQCQDKVTTNLGTSTSSRQQRNHEVQPWKGISRQSTEFKTGHSRKLDTSRASTNDHHVQETVDFLITLSGESSGLDT